MPSENNYRIKRVVRTAKLRGGSPYTDVVFLSGCIVAAWVPIVFFVFPAIALVGAERWAERAVPIATTIALCLALLCLFSFLPRVYFQRRFINDLRFLADQIGAGNLRVKQEAITAAGEVLRACSESKNGFAHTYADEVTEPIVRALREVAKSESPDTALQIQCALEHLANFERRLQLSIVSGI